MPKIHQCNRCSLYARSNYLVCGLYPDGVDTEKCMDFRPDPNAHIEEQWSPQGYSWYSDELIPDRPSRYSQSEQIQILDTHPFFTGVCPQCRHEFDKDNLPVHFDCPNCPKGYRYAYDFIDDSESAIAYSSIGKA